MGGWHWNPRPWTSSWRIWHHRGAPGGWGLFYYGGVNQAKKNDDLDFVQHTWDWISKKND